MTANWIGILIVSLMILGNSSTDSQMNVDLIKQTNVKSANISCTSDCCRSLSDREPMVYTFYQNTGRFIGGKGQFMIDVKTYSGADKGYLNPELQCTPNIGVLPASTYKVGYCKNVMHEVADRPCSFYLDPQRPEEMCNRGDFFIHGCQCCTPGDDTNPPAAGCSAGCIVMSYANRKKIRIGDTVYVKHYEPSQIEVIQ